MRYSAGLLLGLVMCLAAVVGCGDEAVQGISFRAVAAPLASGGRCPVDPQLAPMGQPAVDSLRLTFRAAQHGDFLCDVLVDVDAGEPIVAIPQHDGPIDVFADYFAGTDLIASGVVANVDFAVPQLVNIVTQPANDFACAPARLGTARAFHSATRLPDGSVLIVGGVTSVTDQLSATGGDPLYVSNSVELYDPRYGEVRELSVQDLLPRGFHRAVVLSGGNAGEVVIALIGGLTVDGDPARVPAMFTGTPGSNAMRLIPGANAKPAPLELLLYDTASGSISRVLPADNGTPRAFAAVSGGEARPKGTPLPIAIAGGVTDAALSAAVDFEVRDNAGASLGGSAALVSARIGATATALNDGSVLVWGGQLQSADADLLANSGERLIGLGATPNSAALSFSALGMQPTPRLHHAATRAGDGRIVVAGGYRIAQNRADDVDPTFVQVLAYDGQIQVSEPSTTSGITAIGAGYPAAVGLGNGDVLISGGNADTIAAGCAGAVHPLACSTAAAYRFEQTTDKLNDVPELQVSRFGHRMTLLPGGAVLVSGGLHAQGQSLLLLPDLEVFNPTTTTTNLLDDVGVMRQPGDIARTSAGDPVSECVIVQ